MSHPGFGVLRLVGAFFLLALHVVVSFRLCVDADLNESGDKSPVIVPELRSQVSVGFGAHARVRVQIALTPLGQSSRPLSGLQLISWISFIPAHSLL